MPSIFNLKKASPGIFTFTLRGASIFSRFLLMFSLARLFSVEKMGEYGVMVASVEFVAYSLGLEFHTYSGRDIICRPSGDWPKIIRDQFVFHAMTYALFISIATIFVIIGWWRGGSFIWFIGIVTSEFLAQEFYRLLVVLSYPTHANVLHFLRSAAWIYPIIAILWLRPEARDLSLVWAGWLVGACMSLLIPLWTLRGLNWSHVSVQAIDWGWIKRGIKAALIYFASSSFLRLSFLLDRLILEAMQGSAAVGVYHFFLGIANILTVLTEAGVVIHHYPKLVSVWREVPRQSIQPVLRNFSVSLAITLVGIGATMALAINPFLALIDRIDYQENLAVFWWLLATVVVWCVSFVPHYLLYAKGCDKLIMLSSGIHLLIFSAAAIPLCYSHGTVGVAIAQFIASCTTLLLKSVWAYQK